MKTTVSVLGTGRMGSAIASAFLAQHQATTVWNRSRDKCTPLAERGAHVAATVADAVAASAVIVTVLNDYPTTGALLREPAVARALRGKLLLQLASGSARQAREAAAWAREHEVHYLDGAIMATPDFIAQPGCTILYAGASALFEQYQPLLRMLGGNAQYVGDDAGQASALDSALLMFMWGELFGLLQGAILCEAEGIPLSGYAQHVKAFVPVVDGALTDLVERVQQRAYRADGQTLATLGAHYGAFRHMLESCRAHGLSTAVPAGMGQLFDAAVAAGHAEDDFAALHAFMGPDHERKVRAAG